MKSVLSFRRALIVGLAVVAGAPALAANYPLELVTPRAVNTSPATGYPAINSQNRIFRAHPGMPYNIRAAVIGGGYPYTYTLSNAPSGMTIDSRTGTINWPNPQANASPTITVRDSEGASQSSTWTITVNATGFQFIDAVNGVNAAGNGCSSNCGTGTQQNPWRTVSDMVNSGNTSGRITYFRAGTYRITDLPRDNVGGAWERTEVSGDLSSVIWLAYPNETPVIDFMYRAGGSEWGPFLRMSGSNVYIDSFETTYSHIMALQITSSTGENYRTFRRLRMHDNSDPASDNNGTNAAFIMTIQSYGAWSNYMVVQDCEFYRAPVDPMMKIYSQRKLLIEDNNWHDAYRGLELKADIPQFTVRGNRFHGFRHHAIGGNMDEGTTGGEILFNVVSLTSDLAIDLNLNGTGRRMDIYRNTFVGRVQVQNTDSADGPFRFYNNVIVNNDSGTPAGSHVRHSNVTDASRVVLIDNLAGYPADNLVTTTGALAPAQVRFVGVRGFELGTEIRPQPPSGLVAR